MHISFKRLLMVVLLSTGLVLAESAMAGASDCGIQREIAAAALDEITWKQLNRIYEELAEEHLDEAEEELQKMLARAGRDNYLKAILNQALAQVEWSRKNYPSSLAYFEQAVALDALPDQAHFALMYQIAQLYFMQERNQEALDALALWFCKSPPEKTTSGAFVLQASIYVQMGNYQGALASIDEAIALDNDPQEQWFQLKLAAHYELEQYPEGADTLETMISRWPERKQYWIQLSQIYYRLKHTEEALAVTALAYRRRMLDQQSDITWLSSLYSSAELPFKAAEVLEKGIRDGIVAPSREHWSIVADSWFTAEELEKALSAYRSAGEASADGVTDLRRGYILIDLERWDEALEALNEALARGGLDPHRAGEVYLLRGVAHFNLGDFDSASSDWGKASRHDRSRDAAQQWINHLREERRRQAS